MITKPDSIYQPFCSDGVEGIDYTLPPDSGADTSIVSQPLGAPEIMEEPISAGGLPLLRKQFNGALRKYSDILLWTNAGGQFTFDSTIATETSGYPKDTILFNPETGRFVKSLIDNNTDNFLTDPNKIDNVSWADTQVTLLGNNVNVHTLTTPGIYFQNNPAYATTALNYPFNGFTGAIQVVSVNDGLGSLSISQEAIVVNTNAQTNNSIYNCSNYAGSGFSAWVKQATVNQLQDSSTDIAIRAFNSSGNAVLQKGAIYPNIPGAAGPYAMEFGWDGVNVGSRVLVRVNNNNASITTLANYSDVVNNGGGIVASGVSGGIRWIKYAPDVNGRELIVQWNTSPIFIPIGTTFITLPVSFTNLSLSGVVGSTMALGSNNQVAFSTFSASQISVQCINAGSNVYFIAQGY